MTLSSILVVEDSEPDQFLFKCVIENHDPDIEILQAYDGQQALDILNKNGKSPDVILLDVNMPRMDGFEFLEKYEQTFDENKAGIVVLLTSSNQTKDKEKAVTFKSVKKYIEKPLNDEHLMHILEIVGG